MNATEPMTIDQAVEALVEPETTEEVVEEESQSASEPEADSEVEQPEEDSIDEEEVEDEDDDEPESDDADDDGDEDDEDVVDEAEDEQEPGEVYTVKVNGQEEQVTLEDLKRGYSGQKYVQQGMQQNAEARKELEGFHASLMQERQNLAALMNQVQQGNLTPPKEPSRELFDSDPIGYMEAKMEYDDAVKVYQQNVQQAQQVFAQQQQNDQQLRSRYAQEEAQKLYERLPEIADPAKLDAFKGRIKKAGEMFGYTQQELDQVISHRDMLVLDAAAKYMELQDGKEIVRQKSKKARKPIKAGAKKTNRKTSAVRAQRDKLRQSGSIDDALALILDPNLK